jgi:hypothetical protein
MAEKLRHDQGGIDRESNPAAGSSSVRRLPSAICHLPQAIRFP